MVEGARLESVFTGNTVTRVRIPPSPPLGCPPSGARRLLLKHRVKYLWPMSQNLGLILLATSAFLHALWNSWIKREEQKEAFLFTVIAMGCALAWLGVGTLAQPNSYEGLDWSLAAGVFEGLYLVSLTRTLSLAPLAWAYALMRGGAMAMVWLLSGLILGERTGTYGFLGALLIFSGLWVPVMGLKKTGSSLTGITARGIRGPTQRRVHFRLSLLL